VLTSPAEQTRLVEELRRQLEQRPGIAFACLHGSFRSGGPYRDIDVAVWLDPEVLRDRGGWRYALDLSVDLELALGVPIDVQVLNEAPLAFRYHALAGQPLLVRDQDLLDDLRARTWDSYFDFLPFARQYLRDVLDA
jgi:predicted nucleotidyltransferase